jgi:hypothetical protein
MTGTEVVSQEAAPSPQLPAESKPQWPLSLTSCKVINGIVQIESLNDIETFARFAIASGYFADGDAKSVAQAGMKMMFGLRMRLDPLEAITDLYMFKGQVGVYGRLIARKIKERRESDGYDYFVEESTDKRCCVHFLTNKNERCGFDGTVGGTVEEKKAHCNHLSPISFSIEQAHAMGVTGNKPWKADPALMMFYKVLARAMKKYYPDLFTGVSPQIKEDIEDFVEAEKSTTRPRATPGVQRNADWTRVRQPDPDDVRQPIEQEFRETPVADAAEIEDAAIIDEIAPVRETLTQNAIDQESANLAQIVADREKISQKDALDLNKYAIGRGVSTQALIKMLVSRFKFADPKIWNKELTKGQLREIREELEKIEPPATQQ